MTRASHFVTGWHETHGLPRHAPSDVRDAWHAEHAQACGCSPVPESVQAALKASGKKLCARGHVTDLSGPCAVCWPASTRSSR